MNIANLSRRIAAIESRKPPPLPRIVRTIVDTDREPVAAMPRPGSTLIERQPGESVAALIERVEASR